MSTKYDRVAYPDDLHFAVHGDGDGEEYNRTGNGIYNDYTVVVTPKQYTEKFKIACFSFERSKKKNFVLFGAVATIFVIVVMIIVIISTGKKKSDAASQEKYGLNAYPVSSSGDSMISFNPAIPSTFKLYIDNLQYYLKDYSMEKQFPYPDKYVMCMENTTSLAEGQMCTQTVAQFGSRCHEFSRFGMLEGAPCVLLRLNLRPDSEMPVPFNFTGSQNAALHRKLMERHSNASVAVSCEGKTQADKDLIGKSKDFGPPIDYHPANGFPLYYFLGRKETDYFPPAVMVQFTTIPTNHVVKIKCTAWATNFNDNKPQDSDIYSTEFSFNII